MKKFLFLSLLLSAPYLQGMQTSQTQLYKMAIPFLLNPEQHTIENQAKPALSDKKHDTSKCTICGHEVQDLRRHMYTHDKILRFGCDYPDCTYRAAEKRNVERHKKLMHTPCPFGCDRRPGSLQTHLRRFHSAPAASLDISSTSPSTADESHLSIAHELGLYRDTTSYDLGEEL